MFNRQPRLRTPLPTERVKLPAPPNLPPQPSGVSWLTIGLPLVATMLSVVLMFSILGGSSAVSFLLFIPIMLATALASIIQAIVQKRDYRKQIATAQREYSEALDQSKRKLDGLRRTEQQIRLDNDPAFEVCLRQAESEDARLGERRPTDDDFLAVRIGIGTVSASISIEPPNLNPRPQELAKHFALIDKLTQEYALVPNAPIVIPFRNYSGIAFVGSRQDVAPLARSIVASVTTHHWLSEAQFLVIAPKQTREEWTYLKTLPHGSDWWIMPSTSSANTSVNTERLTRLEVELQKRQQIYFANKLKSGGESDKPILPYLIVIVDHFEGAAGSPALRLLLEKGRELGAIGLFMVEQQQFAPSECGAVVLVDGDRVQFTATGPEGKSLVGAPERVGPGEAADLADALAKIEWLRDEDVSQPPDKVTFMNLLGADSLEELDVFSWWDGNYPYGYLRAPIGKTSRDADLVFDLNDTDGAHGPHGLIGGMTGSGKSELLRTIVLSLALTHHPYDLNFALIDYKGGATFNDLDKLPHTVGVITDIETYASYGERVILSLSSEIERRKRIVEEAKEIFGFGRSHIDEYRKLPVRRPLPRLIVIFDEFASFKQKHPEESKMLIDIARQGRSLGVHMILATQNPGAAVDEQVRQNMTFRILLRVSEPQDSTGLLGIPDAAFLTRGRGYFFVRAPLLFQVAYGGAPYRARKLPEDAIVRILPNKRREILYPLDWGSAATPRTDAIEESESQAILLRILSVSETLGIKKLEPVWQEPLPERLYLPQVLKQVRRSSWDETQGEKAWVPLDTTPALVLGRLDDPAHQRQDYALFHPVEQGGHMLIFGSPGTGKSVLLQTIAMSLARSHPPDEVNLYILDLGGQPVLKPLETLPNVGAVIRPSESERIDRLFKLLRGEVEHRNELLRRAQVGTISAFNNQLKGLERIPYTFVLIDNFGALKTDYLDQARDIVNLANAGRSLGIFFVITSNSDDQMFSELMSNIQFKVTFKQADRSKYNSLVGMISEQRDENEFGSQTKPGRGFLRGNPPMLFQAALPTEGETDEAQVAELNLVAQKMRGAWLPSRKLPQHVEALQTAIPLANFIQRNAENGWQSDGIVVNPTATVGQDYDSLGPSNIDLGIDGQIFMVLALNPQLGKTTTLRAIALSLAERYSPHQVNFIFFDQHKRHADPLRSLPHTLPTSRAKEDVAHIVETLRAEVERRRQALLVSASDDMDGKVPEDVGPAIVMFIDDYPDFMNEFSTDFELQRDLLEILNKAREVGLYLVLSGNLGEVSTEYQESLLRRARNDGSGILLSPREGMDSYKNARIPFQQAATTFPPGRGYFIRRGQPRLIQVAMYYSTNDKQGELNNLAGSYANRIAGIAKERNLIAEWHSSLNGSNKAI